jgi:lipopolysaccharide assembly outer membrane protein LptD (OstA)
MRIRVLTSLLVILLLSAGVVFGQSSRRMNIQYADVWEFIFSSAQDTTFVSGSVVIEVGNSMVYCDSAMWAKGELVMLWGRVVVEDPEFRLVGDSVRYDLVNRQVLALGDYVELWSRTDSLFAVGTHAYYDRGRQFFYMMNRPTVYLNYPDSARMIEVIADFVEYDTKREVAEAEGTVKISSTEFSSASGCAVMRPKQNTLDLFDSPVVRRKRSEVNGRFITVTSEGGNIRRVDVIDSAYAEFVEPINPVETAFDRSILSGRRMLMDFTAGDLRSVTCYDQAYSWYYPAPLGSEEIENSVSGDTIRFSVANEQLQQVEVMGGAIGKYLRSQLVKRETLSDSDSAATGDSITTADSATIVDSAVAKVTDTIDYNSDYISYSLIDSIITLQSHAGTTSGAVALEAHKIQLDTRTRIIEAYSAAILSDSVSSDNMFETELQPNAIPVVLKDKNQNLYGDYLEYSIDTEKGRIVTSKSQYQTGFFYGEKLHRQHKDIFYLENGIYTTCDADEPHFHFKSKNLKLIENKRLIARPVVLSIGRLPILALPYYVFPLQKGRHSGILPFKLGNLERGERYITNVGYYWAASDYWDWQGALDYYDERSRLNFASKVNYKKLYVFDGSISGNWGRETVLNQNSIREVGATSWTLSGHHNHTVTPSFKYSASGSYQSDPDYYTLYSTDEAQRLNRVVRSSLNATKRFGRTTSISATATHDDFLDKRSRNDVIPRINFTLPSINPFGNGTKGDDGILRSHWYNALIISYRPAFVNISNRVTLDSTKNPIYDTTISVDTVIVTDTLTMLADTTITYDTAVALASIDTLSYRSRKEYSRFDHSVTVSLPVTLARYFVFGPQFNYSENWMKVHRTDQSDAKGIDASTTYRGYVYSASVDLSTKLFGTVYPNMFGLIGFRQVFQPSVAYTYTPEIDLQPEVSAYTGGSARSASQSQKLRFGLTHSYQAKVRSGESERNYDLLTVSHSFDYDLEKEERRYSSLRTNVSSNLLHNIQFNATLLHDLYQGPGSTETDLLNPHLTYFQANASINLAGSRFLFDDAEPASIPRGLDSASQLGEPRPPNQGGASGRSGWNLSASLNFSETGIRTSSYYKTSSIQFSLNFYLTATTRVEYSQYYNFVSRKTISNRVYITKTLHCWTGTFFWVPTGSTRGWGFSLNVTALPAIRIDNSQNSLNSSYFQNSVLQY